MIEWKYFHGHNPYRYILDKRTSIDIDDGLDLACARAWLDMDESVSQIDPYIVGGATCNCFLLSVADCADTEKEVAA